MQVDHITRKFEISLRSILEAKLRRFVKRSMFLNIGAGLMLGFGVNELYDIPNQAGLFAASLIAPQLLSGLTIVISSVVQSRRRQGQSMTITFKEDEILIFNGHSQATEAKGWEWVRSAQWINGTYYVDVHPPKLTVILKTLSEEERIVFAEWATNGKQKEAV